VERTLLSVAFDVGFDFDFDFDPDSIRTTNPAFVTTGKGTTFSRAAKPPRKDPGFSL